jgi:N-acetylmuramic acid 6-phosphate etherase
MTDKENKSLFQQLENLTTEQRNPKSQNIDSLSTLDILKTINAEDNNVPAAVAKEIPYIAQAVELIIKVFKNGGRLLYFGAGTSGRIGILDASECPPTFGTPYKMIQGHIAGGKKAMFKSQEGAEDFEENGVNDIISATVTNKDVVCGIAASSRTPYVVGAIKKAKELGATTIYITCNSRTYLDIKSVDVAICPEVGPEIIMGSTRMKSGTAQKLVLNMLTTTAMIRMGKVYENMMIDLRITNKKLSERSKRIVMTITGVSYKEAEKYLKETGGHVKTAIVMIKAGVSIADARIRLNLTDGFVRKAIELK